MRMRKSHSYSQHLRIRSPRLWISNPVCTLDMSFYGTLFPLLVRHHVALPMTTLWVSLETEFLQGVRGPALGSSHLLGLLWVPVPEECSWLPKAGKAAFLLHRPSQDRLPVMAAHLPFRGNSGIFLTLHSHPAVHSRLFTLVSKSLLGKLSRPLPTIGSLEVPPAFSLQESSYLVHWFLEEHLTQNTKLPPSSRHPALQTSPSSDASEQATPLPASTNFPSSPSSQHTNHISILNAMDTILPGGGGGH